MKCCPTNIVAGPDATIWFTSGREVGRLSARGTVTLYTVRTLDSEVAGITVGPDGAMWFTLAFGTVERITIGETLLSTPLLADNSLPFQIAAGSDGALWLTEFDGNKIARATIAAGP